MKCEIETRFAVGDDVALAVHADHPERGEPQLLRVVWIQVYLDKVSASVEYWVRATCMEAGWRQCQSFHCAPTTKGLAAVQQQELVPWSQAREAVERYKAATGKKASE